MIIVRKTRDIEIPLNTIIHGGMGGEFKLAAFQGFEFPAGSGNVFEIPGSRRELQDWSGNHMVNQGLDHYGGLASSSNAVGYCHVGTGNTPPVDADAQLETFVAAKLGGSTADSAQASPPYYGYEEYRYLFSPGFGGGDITISEIAVGTSATPTSITARSLTVDGLGAPSDVSVLATEYLECYYRRRNYPGHITEATGVPTDDTAVVDIQGTPYTYTIRPAMVTVGGTYSQGTGDGWGTFCRYPLRVANGFSSSIYSEGQVGTNNCVLGAVTGTLSAMQGGSNASSADSAYGSSYTVGTYTKELWWQWGISNGNDDVLGIGGLFLKTSLGAYQMTFNNPIPKVYGEVFTFYHNFSWNRKNTWV